MPACLYVTHRWGIHDDRWLAALRALGYEPTTLIADDDLGNLEDIREIVRTSAIKNPRLPILAGPITPITNAIKECSPNIIGLSWGFDMHQPQDLTWLPSLAGLIVDSSATRDIAINAGMPTERVTLLPWGVDLDHFTPDAPTQLPEIWDLPSDARLILSLRAHEPLYRVQDVIEGFAAITEPYPSAFLLVGNDGSLTGDLKTRAQELHLADRVRFIGMISEDELPNLLRGAVVYVTASEVDGTSVTLLQAMACQTPVLASENPGNRGWVTPNTGTLFAIGSPKSLAVGLNKILEDPIRAAHLAKAGRHLIEQNANWSANIHRLGDVLRLAST